MPNWCDNGVTLQHGDPAQITRAMDAFKRGELFQEFVPCPAELLEHDSPLRDETKAAAFIDRYGAADWYDWCVSNWGTKWDASNDGFEAEPSEDGKTVYLNFQTAWSPPIQFLRTMTADFGFDITAYYLEEGASFTGKYTSSADAETYEFSDREDLANIPQDIREWWDLDSIIDQREEWDAEDAERQDSNEPESDH